MFRRWGIAAALLSSKLFGWGLQQRFVDRGEGPDAAGLWRSRSWIRCRQSTSAGTSTSSLGPRRRNPRRPERRPEVRHEGKGPRNWRSRGAPCTRVCLRIACDASQGRLGLEKRLSQFVIVRSSQCCSLGPAPACIRRARRHASFFCWLNTLGILNVPPAGIEIARADVPPGARPR